MNAMNSLFGALPMPGSGGAATPPPEAALPALVPAAGSFDDDSWADVEAGAFEVTSAFSFPSSLEQATTPRPSPRAIVAAAIFCNFTVSPP